MEENDEMLIVDLDLEWSSFENLLCTCTLSGWIADA